MPCVVQCHLCTSRVCTCNSIRLFHTEYQCEQATVTSILSLTNNTRHWACSTLIPVFMYAVCDATCLMMVRLWLKLPANEVWLGGCSHLLDNYLQRPHVWPLAEEIRSGSQQSRILHVARNATGAAVNHCQGQIQPTSRNRSQMGMGTCCLMITIVACLPHHCNC